MLTSPALLNNATDQVTGASSLSQLGEDYTNFLNLLTAQVSNQDPLEPVDASQFVTQLAQLSQVEQTVRTNTQLETLTAQISGVLNLGGIDLLGRSVSVNSDKLMLENGTASTSYDLSNVAQDVTARVIDPLGRVIRTIQGLSGQSGVETQLTWDGTDDFGNPMLAGEYQILITATDDNGDAIPVNAYRDATVQEVRFQEGQLVFEVTGGETVSSISVKSAS
jgi:flagellar basal-body rod modification protein FlgD